MSNSTTPNTSTTISPTLKPPSLSKEELHSAIQPLLGYGLRYHDWRASLSISYPTLTWSETLKNVIIKQELEVFREEILKLRAKPNVVRGKGVKTKSNSLESILKRLQGCEWIGDGEGEGGNEFEERLREGRLLGKDTKIRCLQYHVSRWLRKEAAMKETLEEKNADVTLSPSDTMTCATPMGPSTMGPSLSFTSITSDAMEDPYLTAMALPSKSSTGLLSTLRLKPHGDWTIFEDKEIPWVPSLTNINSVPSFPQEELSSWNSIEKGLPADLNFHEDSFELPRGDGINDSYSYYISRVNQDPDLQKSTLEGIFDFYGTQSQVQAVENSEIWNTSWLEGQIQDNPQYSFTCADSLYQPIVEHTSSAIDLLPSFYDFDSQSSLATPIISQDTPSTQQPYKVIDNAKDSSDSSPLFDYESYLEEKKKELLAAEITVARLRQEITSLERTTPKYASDIINQSLSTAATSRSHHKRISLETPRVSKRNKLDLASPDNNQRRNNNPFPSSYSNNSTSTNNNFSLPDNITRASRDDLMEMDFLHSYPSCGTPTSINPNELATWVK